MKFSTSINIERDSGNNFHYIPTSNGKRVVEQVINDFRLGIHSFNIIGSYGTGKSSLILALESDLKKGTNLLIKNIGQFNDYKEFEFINIVGDYSLLSECLSRKLDLPQFGYKNFFEAFEAYYKKVNLQNKFIVLVVDEFGKILEHAAKNNPEQELYFLQKFAEYINDPKKDILLITTLHQGFGVYANKLNQAQRNEWEKVKGRFKEIVFNEPVEQLLYLAAESINTKKDQEYQGINDLYELASSSKFLDAKLFPLELAEKLYPLDVFSAKTLTLAIQNYGQNERSLFTFLVSNNFADFKATPNTTYSLDKVYDYIVYNFHSLISETHRGSANWTAIQVALERVEGNFDENEIDTVSKIIKIIGLLNIFSPNSCTLDFNFFDHYCSLALGIFTTNEIFDKLERLKIIRYAKYKSQYILFEGTDIDIEGELLHAGSIVPKNQDFIEKLKKYFDFNAVAARAYHYRTGTPRYFQYEISDFPTELKPSGEIDGFVNLLFSTQLNVNELIEYSAKLNNAILFAYFANSEDIVSQLFEIDKYLYILDRVIIDKEDRIARREFERGLSHEIAVLNNIVLNNLFSETSNVIWCFQGQVLDISDRTTFNRSLSVISEKVYKSTPIFKNELVNRHKVSGAISTARVAYLQSLLEDYSREDLGFPKDKFPPEKSIYLTLLKNTGIHRLVDKAYELGAPTEPSFAPLWDLCEDFLENSKKKKRSIKDLINSLKESPFKLKQGFIEFWIPTYLIIKREDYALYNGEAYIPTINREVLDLLQKSPSDFAIKAFSVEGVRLDLFNKYREAINLKSEESIEEESFIETIKPFLTFYNKSLNDYARNTKKLQKKSRDFRNVLATAVDPEQTFFEDLPKVLGFKDIDLVDNTEYLRDFVNTLQDSIRELRTCYGELINRIENYILNSLGIKERDYETYKKIIEKKYKGVKDYLLTAKHKAFLSRVMTPLKDRDAWISSISYPILNKSLETLRDEDEEVLLQGLAHSFIELSNFIDIHKNLSENSQDKVLKLDITSLDKGTNTKQVILPESKVKASHALEEKITRMLSEDENLNLYTLIQILNKKMNK